jgi:hypothetical protein
MGSSSQAVNLSHSVMQRVFSFRQGDRSEYLAQYILSSFAISVPVPRQEDVGNDFHCSLLRRVGDNLQPYLPFNIQIKSDCDALRRGGIKFGGITNSGVWRKHEIENLCQTDTPFLIGIVNKEHQRLDLFTTIPRYFICVNWSGRGKPREVTLLPYSPDVKSNLGNGEVIEFKSEGEEPRFDWKLPIGQPIVSIGIDDAENQEKCEEIKHVIEPYLRLDQDNAVFSRLGLGYFHWPLVIQPGQFSQQRGIGYTFGPVGNPAFNKQMVTLCNIMASILSSFKLAKMKDEIRLWLPIIERIDLSALDPLTQNIFRDAKTYGEQPD